MRDDVSAPGSQRGQALILAMLAMTVVFAIGAIVVDFGFWLSERRGAQTDADFAALAGAWELLDPNGDPAAAASASLAANDEQGNASLANPVVMDDSCFGGGELDAVTVDVRHESHSLFASIFGIFAPDIGARAKACMGATNAPLGIVPFEIDTDMGDCFESDGTPKFDSLCPLDYAAGGSPGGSNPRGTLDLQAGDYCSEAGSSGNLRDLIEWGATGTCLISETGTCSPPNKGPWYHCVAVQNGNSNQVIKGVEDRLGREGDCDTDGNGVESLDEVVDVVFSGSPKVYQARDCNTAVDGAQISPRLVSVIVLESHPTSGNKGYPIQAFAGFYLEGCGSELSPTPTIIDSNCIPGGGGGGHSVVYGRFVNLIVEDSGTGPVVPSTASFSISLEE